MSSNTDARRSKVPGVPDAPAPAGDVTDEGIDFEPEEPSEPETDPENAATGDGGDPYPVPGSGLESR